MRKLIKFAALVACMATANVNASTIQWSGKKKGKRLTNHRYYHRCPVAA